MTASTPRRVATALASARARLIDAGLSPDEARLDARVLLAHVLGLTAPAGLGVRLDDTLPEVARERFSVLIDRRAAREPVGRLLGRRGFWTLDLALGPDTLEPRPDTETVVRALLERLTPADAPWRLLDLGTGTGCILLALLSALPEARGVGVDRAAGAVKTARANATAHGLAQRATLRQGDWADGVGALGVAPGSLDAVVSNPPYIPTADLVSLVPEVRDHDPALALDGGADGLDAYRVLVPLAMTLLRPGGWLALEVGADQAGDVGGLMTEAGFPCPAVVHDLAGHGRCVIAARPPKKGGAS